MKRRIWKWPNRYQPVDGTNRIYPRENPPWRKTTRPVWVTRQTDRRKIRYDVSLVPAQETWVIYLKMEQKRSLSRSCLSTEGGSRISKARLDFSSHYPFFFGPASPCACSGSVPPPLTEGPDVTFSTNKKKRGVQVPSVCRPGGSSASCGRRTRYYVQPAVRGCNIDWILHK